MEFKTIPPDPRFEHVSYYHTDLRKTFARVRAELAAQAQLKGKVHEHKFKIVASR
jgi:hypothetical protein